MIYPCEFYQISVLSEALHMKFFTFQNITDNIIWFYQLSW